MKVLAFSTVLLALLNRPAIGADHDVMQVKSPHVVKHPLGPLMEVHRTQPVRSTSFRKLRDANFPGYGTGCYSCSLGTYGSSDFSSGSSSSSSGYSAGSSYTPGYPAYGAPRTTSSRQEFRREQKFVNGQPVYDLHHQRKFEDGHLVHEEKTEKDEDDFGISRTHGSSSGGYASGSGYEVPGYSRSYGESRRKNYTYGSHGYGGYGTDGYSSSYDAEVAKLRESLHRQAGTHRSYPISPSTGGSHRTEFHTQTRYVNGQPVYVKKEEKRYEDGKLVHDHTEEKDADDLGTSEVEERYDSGASPVGEGIPGGYYERRHQYQETFGGGKSWYPVPSSHYGAGHRTTTSSSSSTARQSGHSGYQPTYDYSTAYGREYPASGTHQPRGSTSSSYPSYHGSERYDSRREYTSYPAYNPHPESSSSHARQDSYGRYSPSYKPSHESSSSVHYRQESSIPQHTQSSVNKTETSRSYSSSSYVPTSGSSSSFYVGSSQRGAASPHPSHVPSSESSVTRTSEESSRTYPASGHSTTRTSEDSYSSSSYRPSAGSHSSHPSSRTSDDRSSSSFSGVRYSSSSSHSSEGGRTREQDISPTEEIEDTHLLQSSSGASRGSIDSYSTHVNINTTSHRSSDSGHTYGDGDTEVTRRRPIGDARTFTINLSSTAGSDSSRNQVSDHDHSRDSIGGGVHLSEHEDHFSSSSRAHQASRTHVSSSDSSQIGVPGVISGPNVSYVDGSYQDKERYDISPLEDELPYLPEVENEVETSSFPRQPTEDEIHSREIHRSTNTSDEISHSRPSDLPIQQYDHTYDTSVPYDRTGSVYSQSSYHYNETHNIYGRPIAQPASRVDHSHYDHSRSSTVDGSQRTYPTTSGTSRYHYNETRRHSSFTGGHQPAITGSTVTSGCTQSSGCSPGSSHISSRRSETRTSRRYVNGQLVGITHYERLYQDGNLVHENVTERGIDELTPQELEKYGIDQLNLVHGSYEPDSYSQRHEVKQEKKYVNGQQIYDLHHERRFEDGQLVHENRTEKDEDDFGAPRPDETQLGIGHERGYFDAAGRHEVTQSQHLRQHVTSDSRPGSARRSSETHQATDTSRVVARPVYTTHRNETRRQQEYIDGMPVYDLRHERRYQDGSLVYENRTELDERDSKGSGGGYRDALHQMMSGEAFNTAYESSFRRPVSVPSGSGSYDSYGSSSHEGSSSSSSSVTQEASSSHQEHGASFGTSLLTGDSASRHSSGGATTTIFGASPTFGSSSGSSSSRQHGSSYGATQESSSSSSSFGTSLLSGGSTTGHSSGGATTTIFGASPGHEASGADSSSYSGSSYESKHESSSSSLGSSLLSGGSTIGRSSGGATTTIFGASPGHGVSGADSSRYSGSSYESTHESSSSSLGSSLLSGGSTTGHSSGGATTTIFGASSGHEVAGSDSSRHSGGSYGATHESSSSSSSSRSGSGCLSCVLLGGSGYSSHGSSASHSSSHGHSTSVGGGGAGVGDGYSQRREMSREEYYEDGQLVKGREEDRSYKDGRLIQENRRVYSGAPGQIAGAEALQSAGTSYVSSSSSSSSSSSGDGSTGYGTRVTVQGDTTGVCDPNPCHNGGSCISGHRGPLCVCTFGFKGMRCEEAYCPRRYCRRGGSCNVVDGKHECSCRSGYTGDRCQRRG